MNNIAIFSTLLGDINKGKNIKGIMFTETRNNVPQKIKHLTY